jgi:S-adenosylmethionine synthetase
MFTSESVTEGHPDKIADQISDSILDDLIAQDKKSRVACETLVTTGVCLVAGEITTEGYCDIPRVVRETIKEIGYNDSSMGFDWETCAVLTSIDRQSADISVGVTEGEGLHKEQGAGDQGLMFGYACDDTPELMPMPIVFAHKITKGLAEARRDGRLPFLRPDGKSQVTVQYADASPKNIHTVVVSTQHTPDVDYEKIREGVIEEVVKKVLPKKYFRGDVIYHINPTGRFVAGGPHADCGLTGRKIIVDTYGGQGSHGGGAFSGKDPSKVDRSASYMARYIAKNIIAAGLAKRCEVQIAYAIGVAEPVSVLVNPFRTGKIPTKQFIEIVRRHFPLKPREIIDALDLLRPIFKKTAAYGHFGRDEPEFTWERTDKAEELKQYLP